MTFPRYLLLLSLVIGVLTPTAFAESAEPDADPWSKPMLLGAHRAGQGEWPENTVLAFKEAANKFPTILLEGDLQLTKDGEVVVIHDLTVDRTTNGTGAVKDLTLAEVKALDAGYHFTVDDGASFPWRGKGITIPTFDEVLAVMPNHRALFELKDSEGLVEKVAPIIRTHNATKRILIASFKPELMAAFRAQMPDMATCYDMRNAIGLLFALRGGDWENYVPTDRMLSLTKGHVAQYKFTAAEVKKLQAKGVLVQVHTLNTPEEIAHFVELGVDSILTDLPTLLQAERKDRRRRYH